MTTTSANGRTAGPNFIRTADGTDLFFRDWGAGQPVLFVGGWSMPSESWQYQMLPLLDQGYRVIAFDRRGHGRSADPGRGYDFDTLADDIAAIIEALDLRGVTLVGHSMGCNEIVRYLSNYGSERVAKAALLGAMTPFILKTDDNPGGIDGAAFEFFRSQQLMRDFPQWVDDNMVPFVHASTPQGIKDWFRQMAFTASLHALRECNRALVETDLREDLKNIDVPVLLIAGDSDASAPLELTARPTAALLPTAQLKIYEGAPHAMFITDMERVNADLLEFIGEAGTEWAQQQAA
jgi:non-heme chloroperoxidase